jgi:hypothetical protein
MLHFVYPRITRGVVKPPKRRSAHPRKLRVCAAPFGVQASPQMRGDAAKETCFCFSGREVAFVVAVTALAMGLSGEPAPAGPFDWVCFVAIGGTGMQWMPIGVNEAGLTVRAIIVQTF